MPADQVKDIAENQRIAKERKEAEQGPRLAKGMPVAAPRDTFEGTPSRLELEVRLGVVLAELSEERERSRVAERKCEELKSEASRQVVTHTACVRGLFIDRFASSCARESLHLVSGRAESKQGSKRGMSRPLSGEN